MVMTPNMEATGEGELRKSLHLEDLLEQKTQYQYTTWCANHAVQVSKMITGGLSFLGIWVYCTKEELKETKCQNLLLSVLSKAKKITKAKEPLSLFAFFADSRGQSLPEIWMPSEDILKKSKNVIKPFQKSNQIVQLNTSFPFSMYYPLPNGKESAESANFRTIMKKMGSDLHDYIYSLRYTVGSDYYEDNENISAVHSSVKIFITNYIIELQSNFLWDIK